MLKGLQCVVHWFNQSRIKTIQRLIKDAIELYLVINTVVMLYTPIF